MPLNKKLRILTTLFTVITVCIVGVILILISSKSYYDVEDGTYRHSLLTIERAVGNVFYENEYILADWAQWDASLDFVNGHNPTYVEDNFSDSVLDDLDLDYMVVYDSEGRMLIGFMNDEQTHERINLSQELSERFVAYKDIAEIIMINDAPVLFTAMGITDNEAITPAVGQMGFGRILDDSALEKIESSVNMDLTAEVEARSAYPDATIDNSYGFFSVLTHNQFQPSIGKVGIPISNSSNAIVLTATFDNAIQKLGRSYIQLSTLVVLGVLLLFGICLDIIFRKAVIERLIELNAQVGTIRKLKSTKERLGIAGGDEIGELGDNINALLDEIDQMHQEVSHYATFDAMTGAYNRRVGLDILENLIELSKSEAIEFGILYIDVDGLKRVNDHYGHHTGDQLILDEINLIRSVTRNAYPIVRLGGDEFVVIFKGVSEPQVLELMAQLTQAAETFNQTSQAVYTLSISMGHSMSQKEKTLELMFEEAEKDMYTEKKAKNSQRH